MIRNFQRGGYIKYNGLNVINVINAHLSDLAIQKELDVTKYAFT